MHQALHTKAIRAAAHQAGVLQRSQLLQLGFTDAYLRGFIRDRRFSKLAPGVYNTVTGEPTPGARRWAAHLLCGPRSYLFGASALHFWGMGRGQLELWIAVPAGARRMGAPSPSTSKTPSMATAINCVQVHAHRQIKTVRDLPVEAPADALIDSTRRLTDPDAVQNLISDCVQQRVVDLRDLEVAIRRPRMPHSEVFADTVGLLQGGRTTPLEIMADRKVVAKHGLPKGVGQAVLHLDGARQVVDLFYPDYGVIVEFDGKLGHYDAAGKSRDSGRDNRASGEGIVTLRFGWNDVRYRACDTARQIAILLQRKGWQRSPKRCSSQNCDVDKIIR